MAYSQRTHTRILLLATPNPGVPGPGIKIMPRSKPAYRFQLASVIILITIWELSVSVVAIISPTVLPAPRVIGIRTVTLLADEQFVNHMFVTLRRTLSAALLATVFGVSVGVAMGWSNQLRALLSPLFSALYSLPVVALLPLILIIVGTTDTSIILIAALGGFFLLLWNVVTGVRSINQEYLEVARHNGARSRITLFREVLLPGSLPMIFVGLRLALSTSLLIVIAVELLAGSHGLGYVLWRSWRVYVLVDVYATLIVIGFFGILITYGLEYVRTRVIPWKTDLNNEVFI